MTDMTDTGTDTEQIPAHRYTATLAGAIEERWQRYWETNKVFRAPDQSSKPKFYCLDFFPYPSGTGLHVGHLEGYVATDMADDDLSSPRGTEIRGQSPFNRIATPEEIAAAVVYLASPEAEWASGAVLDLNGASYLR